MPSLSDSLPAQVASGRVADGACTAQSIALLEQSSPTLPCNPYGSFTPGRPAECLRRYEVVLVGSGRFALIGAGSAETGMDVCPVDVYDVIDSFQPPSMSSDSAFLKTTDGLQTAITCDRAQNVLQLTSTWLVSQLQRSVACSRPFRLTRGALLGCTTTAATAVVQLQLPTTSTTATTATPTVSALGVSPLPEFNRTALDAFLAALERNLSIPGGSVQATRITTTSIAARADWARYRFPPKIETTRNLTCAVFLELRFFKLGVLDGLGVRDTFLASNKSSQVIGGWDITYRGLTLPGTSELALCVASCPLINTAFNVSSGSDNTSSVVVRASDCFDSELTCASCCATGKTPLGYCCFTLAYPVERCCGANAPVRAAGAYPTECAYITPAPTMIPRAATTDSPSASASPTATPLVPTSDRIYQTSTNCSFLSTPCFINFQVRRSLLQRPAPGAESPR